MREQELVDRLTSSLKTKLGPAYRVTQNYASASIEGLSPDARPDIVIMQDGSQRTLIVEVKTPSEGQELPLATARTTLALKQANAAFNPLVALVTSPRTVSPLLKEELDAQRVAVLSDGDFETVVSRLVKLASEAR
ncbi:hypothetical protein AB1286_08560 [Trinickia sp. NRRL B-1857]|uniref:hypothetical protein n=1 Tax=Trinickia sp. NRRL B-1857 TaxID=3162879 RepID=UPI003D2E7DEE